jgi:hypothetical protein
MEDFKGHAVQCEDCGRRAEADEGAGWVAVHLESDRGVEVLTYCENCAKQFELDDISPINLRRATFWANVPLGASDSPRISRAAVSGLLKSRRWIARWKRPCAVPCDAI